MSDTFIVFVTVDPPFPPPPPPPHTSFSPFLFPVKRVFSTTSNSTGETYFAEPNWSRQCKSGSLEIVVVPLLAYGAPNCASWHGNEGPGCHGSCTRAAQESLALGPEPCARQTVQVEVDRGVAVPHQADHRPTQTHPCVITSTGPHPVMLDDEEDAHGQRQTDVRHWHAHQGHGQRWRGFLSHVTPAIRAGWSRGQAASQASGASHGGGEQNVADQEERGREEGADDQVDPGEDVHGVNTQGVVVVHRGHTDLWLAVKGRFLQPEGSEMGCVDGHQENDHDHDRCLQTNNTNITTTAMTLLLLLPPPS